MILIPNRRISREFIIEHPNCLFIHSKPYWPVAPLGPAQVCAGLSNCFGIPVRWRYCKSSGYFGDYAVTDIKRFVDEAIAAIPKDGRPIILFPKIGNGDARMHVFAPKAWAYMMEKLNAIKSKDYRYDYTA